jgi:hypothetical protein
MNPWSKDKAVGDYVTELAELTHELPGQGPGGFLCPCCEGRITRANLTGTDADASGEDTYGRRYQCPNPTCGARMLIIND